MSKVPTAAPVSPDEDRRRPRKSTLRRMLEERPESQSRLGHAIGSLLGATLVAVATITLGIWHLRRRADLVRARLGPPRASKRLREPLDDQAG